MEYQEAAKKIVERIKNNDFLVSEHVVRFIMAGKITTGMIRDAVSAGKIIEVQNHPARGKSFLIAGFSGKTPVHLVCAFNNPDHMMLIFAYVPSLPVWKNYLDRNIKERGCQVDNKSQNCFFCTGELKNITFASFDYRLDGKLYVVNDVEAGLCTRCGEKYISQDTANEINDHIAAGNFKGTEQVHVIKLGSSTNS